MKYYTIVTKIGDEFESGIYGRRKLNPEKIKKQAYYRAKSVAWIDWTSLTDWVDSSGFLENHIYPHLRKIPFANDIYEKFKTKNLFLIQPLKTNNKTIIISNDSLNGDYRINDKFTSGLLKDSLATKIIMQSKGGSDICVLGRNDMPPNLKHISSLINVNGIESEFSEGIYTVHPKKENILVPVANIETLIQKLILHETINCFVMLGAKSILIKDLTEAEAEIKGGAKKNTAKIGASSEKSILHKKDYGEGTYNPELALKNKMFIADYLEVMGIAENRINANQTLESVTEKIDLSMGLDLNVVAAFNSKAKFEYFREWKFEVEFYDKTEFKKSS